MAPPRKPLFDAKEASTCVQLFKENKDKRYIMMERIARIIHRDREVVRRYFNMWLKGELNRYDPDFAPEGKQYSVYTNPPSKDQLMGRK